MTSISLAASRGGERLVLPGSKTRIESIDLLRGVVMILMALDHVRNYFHYDAFLYNPTDLEKTNVPLFFTRWITHYCAPVFIFLAGLSARLSGMKKSKKQLSLFLLTRGIWLVAAEIFIVGLFRTFNPAFTYVNLQVIFAIGICMIALAAIIYLKRRFVLALGLVLISAHHLLDDVHVPGNGIPSFLWSVLHDVNHFSWGSFEIFVRYPVLPWIGVIALGYCFGSLYANDYDAGKRRKLLRWSGIGAIALFILLRWMNMFGDMAKWTEQENFALGLLSFLNVTKYPPSLLYVLMTLGPALVFLSLAERPLNRTAASIVVFGRVPMFYYLAHILLIHILAVIAALLTGFPEMIILQSGVNMVPELKGYGFNLAFVHGMWLLHVLILYPFCKWFGRYKQNYQVTQWWVSYL